MNIEIERLVEFGSLIIGFVAFGGVMLLSKAYSCQRKLVDELRGKLDALESANNPQRGGLDRKASSATNAM